MNQYGVVIDANMVRNVFGNGYPRSGQSNHAQYAHLMSAFLAYCRRSLFFVPWTQRTFGDEALAKLKFAGRRLVLLAFSVVPFWGDFFRFCAIIAS